MVPGHEIAGRVSQVGRNVTKFKVIGRQKRATPAQLSLAWLLVQEQWIVPIPGSRKMKRLDENLGALSVELTPDDLREIEVALSTVTVQGSRY
jgi:aryl-alcohol dehydrogenase-like predicted oxidoreductase